MLKILKYSYSLADLHYNPTNLPQITTYFQRPSDSTSPFFYFGQPATLNFIQKILPSSKQHQQLIELYLNFIKIGEQHPKNIAYRYLEGNLRNKVLEYLHKQKVKVVQTKLTTLKSQMIEHCIFRGVLIDRKYNLNLSSYEFTQNKSHKYVYELKKTLRKDAAKLYDILTQEYAKNNMEEVYGVEISKFINEYPVNRYLFQMILDIQMTVSRKGTLEKIGGNGPTKHIVQIESLYDYFSNNEEFYLTDVDFILKGNSFFRDKAKL